MNQSGSAHGMRNEIYTQTKWLSTFFRTVVFSVKEGLFSLGFYQAGSITKSASEAVFHYIIRLLSSRCASRGQNHVIVQNLGYWTGYPSKAEQWSVFIVSATGFRGRSLDRIFINGQDNNTFKPQSGWASQGKGHSEKRDNAQPEAADAGLDGTDIETVRERVQRECSTNKEREDRCRNRKGREMVVCGHEEMERSVPNRVSHSNNDVRSVWILDALRV